MRTSFVTRIAITRKLLCDHRAPLCCYIVREAEGQVVQVQSTDQCELATPPCCRAARRDVTSEEGQSAGSS